MNAVTGNAILNGKNSKNNIKTRDYNTIVTFNNYIMYNFSFKKVTIILYNYFYNIIILFE